MNMCVSLRLQLDIFYTIHDYMNSWYTNYSTNQASLANKSTTMVHEAH